MTSPRRVLVPAMAVLCACSSPTAVPSGESEAALGSGDPMGCPAGPCAERPVIFVHGQGGDNADADGIFAAMTEPGERWDSRTDVGTADHASWEPRSIPRRRWLFAFDYYVASGSDRRGSYSAGPGRIGSDSSFACDSPSGRGRIVPDSGSYDAETTHDYSADLASMIDDVLRATGASKVDIVTHSMGGLVTRSYLAFLGGNAKVERLLLLSSPHVGVPFATLAAIATGKSWMTAHEWTELDRGSFAARSKFSRCGVIEKNSWPKLLLAAEETRPIQPEVHCMSGSKDILVSYDAAHHPKCLDHVVVPGASHGGILKAIETTQRARELLGGRFGAP